MSIIFFLTFCINFYWVLKYKYNTNTIQERGWLHIYPYPPCLSADGGGGLACQYSTYLSLYVPVYRYTGSIYLFVEKNPFFSFSCIRKCVCLKRPSCMFSLLDKRKLGCILIIEYPASRTFGASVTPRCASHRWVKWSKLLKKLRGVHPTTECFPPRSAFHRRVKLRGVHHTGESNCTPWSQNRNIC